MMLEKIKEILHRLLPDADIDAITPETKLVDDLGFDSLTMMAMSMELEESLGFRFEEQVVFISVGDVIKYLDTVVK